MTEASIDRLTIEVSSDAQAAVRSLNNLAAALGTLETRVGSSAAKLLKFTESLRAMKQAASGFDVSGLKELGALKFSATVPKNLGSLASTLTAMPADSVAKLSGIGSALGALNGVKLPKDSVTQLAKLPQIFREFQGFDMGAFTSQMGQLNAQLAPLATSIDRLATSYAKLPKSMQTAGLAARSVASSNKYLQQSNTALIASNGKLASSFNETVSAMKGMAAKALGFSAACATARRVLGSTIGNVNSYIENMNLFEASMGRYTQSATEFGQKVQDLMGIDFGEWARNQGVFMTLATGMGVAADRASVMSQQLTQLGYDISSFYNISVEDAMLKLQSGIAGELEPLRRIGWDLSNARMQAEMTGLSIEDLAVDMSDAAIEAEALNMGLKKKVANMTQAEKVAIRYHLIMTQVTQVHGDMARTIDSPANQLRVLQAQIQLTARAVGNLLIPALNSLLPVVMAVVKAVRLLAEQIAALFGIDAKFEVDYSSLDTSGINLGADEFEEAAEAAEEANKSAKKYKNTVMGFDELNKLNAPTGKDDDDSGKYTGPSIADMLPLETYDFLDALQSDISRRTDEMAEKLLGIGRAAGEAVKLIGPLATVLGKVGERLGTLGEGEKLFGTLRNAAEATKKKLGKLFDKLDEARKAIKAKLGKVFEKLDEARKAVKERLGKVFEKLDEARKLVKEKLGKVFSKLEEVIEAVKSKLGTVFEKLNEARRLIKAKLGELFSPLSKAAEAVKAKLGELFSKLDEARKLIKAKLGEMFAPLSRAADVVKSKLGGVFSKLSEAIKTLKLGELVSKFSKIGEVAAKVGGKLGEIFGPFLKFAAPALKTIGKFLGPLGDIISIVDLFLSGKSMFDAIQEGADISVDSIVGLSTSFLGLGLSLAPFTGGISLIVGAVLAAVTVIGSLIYNNWEEISAFFLGIPEWFDTNVIQPVQGFFTGLPDFFSGLWEGIVGGVSEWWGGVAKWFDDNVVKPVQNFFSPIANFFSKLWGGIVKGISGAFGGVASWFDNNVVKPVKRIFEPIANWFGQLWESISATASAMWYNIGVFADGCWQIVKRVWEVVSGWFDQNIIQPLSGFFSGLWSGISGAAGTAWTNIQGAWNAVSNWFNTTVVQPVQGFFTGLWSGITGAASTAWTNIKNTWNAVTTWFDNNVVQPVKNAFSGAWSALTSGASTAWTDIKNVFSKVATFFKNTFSAAWKGVTNVFSLAGNLFQNVSSAIVSAFTRVGNQIISGINTAIAMPFNGINWVLGQMRGWEILDIHPFAAFVDIPIPKIPYLAEGRYGINQGQLFVARERGAEMVGSMNGHTTVANNQQIVEGIEAGVASAMLKVLAVQDRSGAEAQIEIPLIVDGEVLANAVWRGEASLIRRGELKPMFA